MTIAQGLLADTAALAAVALIGYLFGRRTRTEATGPVDAKLLDGLSRAQCIANDLEHIALRVRGELSDHQAGIAAFQAHVESMRTGGAAADWTRLGEQTEALLGPMMKFATNLSTACDQLRCQQSRLIMFSGSRIDRTTGLHNRRSMQEQLDAILSASTLDKRRLALAVFSVGPVGEDATDAGEAEMKGAARLIEECVRGNDFVARYSDDEFVVLMPKTTLAGALVFSERLIRLSHQRLGQRVCGGVVEAAPGEPPQKLLSRADSALYSARTEGAAALFQHTGAAVRRYPLELGDAGTDDAVETPCLATASAG